MVPSEPPLRAELEAAGATVHIVPMRRISRSFTPRDWLAYAWGWPVAVTRLVRLVRRLDVDVVHTNSLHSWYGWAVAGLTRRPHVWHAREIVVQSGAALRVERFLTRHFATRVACASHAIADQLHTRNTVVVYDAPDGTVFSPARAGAFRARHRIADDVPLAGFVGRFDTWKGLDVLLDAWPRLKLQRTDAHLVVAGGPVLGKEPYAEDLARRAAALPDVHWLGELAEGDVAALLADLDVLAVPSTEPEPFGLAMIEALMSGTPVVATDAGGPREIAALAAPGSTRLVPPRDADALVDALDATLDGAHAHTRTSLVTIPPGDLAGVLRAAARERQSARAPDGGGTTK